MRLAAIAAILFSVIALSACGKKSPLSLPEDSPQANSRFIQATTQDASLRLISFQDTQ